MTQHIQYTENMAGNFRLGAFATGSYNCHCVQCGTDFIGDKRAVLCLECAIEGVEAKAVNNAMDVLVLAREFKHNHHTGAHHTHVMSEFITWVEQRHLIAE